MSNGVKRPKGYTDRKAKDLQAEYNQVAYELGKAILTQLSAESDQQELEELGQGLLKQFIYASRQEALKSAAESKAPEASQASPESQPEAAPAS